MTFRSLAKLNVKQKEILVSMHYGKRASYDAFDFPGTSPSTFDELMTKFGAICGTHRNGFSISARGAAFAAKFNA